MSNKHTPGPWVIETVPTSVGICHKIGPFPPRRPDDVTYRSSCLYADYPSGYNPADNELYANARLIAAAPDLLEALERLVTEIILSDVDVDMEYIDSHFKPHIEKARAAIAKATGGDAA